jgi:ABC-type phosphate transport system substrate-binding protein
MNKTKLLLGSLLFAGAISALPAAAGEIFVIANNNLDLSADDVREIFIGDKQIAAGSKVVPMDNAALQKDFIEKALKLDPTKYASIWTKKGFRDGLNPPPVKSGDVEVIAAVKSTPGAIGYVSSLPAGVKLVKKF